MEVAYPVFGGSARWRRASIRENARPREILTRRPMLALPENSLTASRERTAAQKSAPMATTAPRGGDELGEQEKFLRETWIGMNLAGGQEWNWNTDVRAH